MTCNNVSQDERASCSARSQSGAVAELLSHRRTEREWQVQCHRCHALRFWEAGEAGAHNLDWLAAMAAAAALIMLHDSCTVYTPVYAEGLVASYACMKLNYVTHICWDGVR